MIQGDDLGNYFRPKALAEHKSPHLHLPTGQAGPVPRTKDIA